MSNLFALGARLRLCADFVRPGVRFADIGTDHGYLPIWLLKNKKITSATAADIGEGPLNSAIANGERYGAKIKTVLSNGFASISPDEFDDAVIAGMGGELISEIISSAPFTWNEEKHLILQPMTAVPKLREFLSENKFEILTEKAVIEDKKIYSVMNVRAVKIPCPLTQLEIYMGKIIPHSEYSKEYAEKALGKLGLMLKGAKHNEQLSLAHSLTEIIKEIEKTYL